MNQYILKTRADMFARTWDGEKTVEVREALDRDYQIGDQITLIETYRPGVMFGPPTDESDDEPTGRECDIRVTHVLRGEEWGLKAGYVAMSFFKLTQRDSRDAQG